MVYIFWTSADLDEARKIGAALLDLRLIACASIFPVESIYRWKGKVERGAEVKVLFKTKKEQFKAIEEYILNEGSYEVPEIALVETSQVHANYLKWLLVEAHIPN